MDQVGFNVQQLSVSYKRLVLWFGVQLLLAIVGAIALVVLGETVLGIAVALVRVVGLLVTVVALAVYSYRTAVALGSRVGALWAVAMVIPFVNVISLLALSSKATRACRAAGVPVGFLGPKSVAATGQSEPR